MLMYTTSNNAIDFYRTSMMEGSGTLEQQLEATKVCTNFF
jgi:hypothetical protein